MKMEMDIKTESVELPMEDPLLLQPCMNEDSKYLPHRSKQSIKPKRNPSIVHRCVGKIARGMYRRNGIHSIPSTRGTIPIIAHRPNTQPFANQTEAETIVLDSTSDEGKAIRKTMKK